MSRNIIVRGPGRRARVAPYVALYVALGWSLLSGGFGCRTLSAQAELAQAADEVASRSGVSVRWPGLAGGTSSASEFGLALRGAPSADRTRALDMARAAQLALAHHPRLRAEMADVIAARADLVQAGLLPNPVVQALVGARVDGDGGTPALLSAVQTLAALWTRPARVASVEARLRAQVLRLSDAALRLVAEVRTRFAEVALGAERVRLDMRLTELREEQLTLSAIELAAGEGDLRGYNDAQLRAGAARDRELAGEERWQRDRHRLAELIGGPRGDCPELVAELPAAVLAFDDGSRAFGEEELLAQVRGQRLDVMAAFVALGDASGARDLAERQRLPEVAAGATFQRNLEGRQAVSGQLRVTLPIFDSGAAQVAKARAIEARAIDSAEALLWSAWLEVRLAHESWQSARERYWVLTRDRLAAARANVELVQAMFAAGEASRADLIDEQVRELELLRKHNEVELAAYRAYFELERAIGGRLGHEAE